MEAYKKGQVWNKSKNKLMLEFEKETGKNAIYSSKITGGFEAWIYKRKEKEIETKPVEIKEEVESIEKPTIDIFPAKFLKVNEKLQVAINKLFSYNVNFLNPETKSRNKFNVVVMDTICPSCKSIMHCTDCWNIKKLKVTFMRMCHECRSIYMFTCKYENREEIKERYNFFVNHIYKIRGVKSE